MEEDYDKKFEDMKRYIPFLDDMIHRLENAKSGPGNPRHAQLTKIKALRDLLLDKSKRMKMDNLLKCEQVLINLYAKVEQRERLSDVRVASNRPKEKAFDSARQKLKVLSSQTVNVDDDEQDTLPEIARADQSEVVCSPGSKEPALFQRRPNKCSPTRSSLKEDKSLPKRNYTRVLVSPDQSPKRRSGSGSREREKRMYQKKSPPKSPSQQKRKSRRDSDNCSKVSRDVNILLQVPQKSLEALNTENIGERIMNCDDTDVDINTLRELRSQILSELKKTGSNDDISDIIMKSYNKKELPKKTKSEKIEVEDGEISDSESETIDHVYRNLVVVNDSKNCNDKGLDVTKSDSEAGSRKIQICLVVGDASKNPPKSKITSSTVDTNDIIDLDKCNDSEDLRPNPNDFDLASKSEGLRDSLKEISLEPTLAINLLCEKEDVDDKSKKGEKESPQSTPILSSHATAIDILNISKTKIHVSIPKVIEPRKANFYTPVADLNEELQQDQNETSKAESQIMECLPLPATTPTDVDVSTKESAPIANEIISMALEQIAEPTTSAKALSVAQKVSVQENVQQNEDETNNKTSSLKIPFIGDVSEKPKPPKESVVSEIEILQALKNEILSESINLPNTETPTLHQPKLTKVTDVKEINKKKISLDKYKQQTLSSTSVRSKSARDSPMTAPKQSRGLTEKECERFKLPCRLSLDGEYSSEDEGNDKRTPSPTDTIYGDLAPQSPDAQPNADEVTNEPVIIPAEPLKPSVASSKTDIDMRALPLSNIAPVKPNLVKEVTTDIAEKNIPRPHDPRLRKDVLGRSHEKTSNLANAAAAPLAVPSPYSALSPYPNMTPSRTPNSRSIEIGTPSHQTFDLTDSNCSRKHVYAPSFASFDASDTRESSILKDPCLSTSALEKYDKYDSSKRDSSKSSRSKWDDGQNICREEDSRYERSTQRDYYKDRQTRPNYERKDYRDNYPTTPVHSFGRSDAPMTPLPLFGRAEAPTTPLPSFGRSEAPMTPLPSFGRSEGPSTPMPSFGRSDVQMTSRHSYGRSECSTTPIHPFGRSEMPRTPSHPFGRADYAPNTPSHPFGRSEYQRSSSHSYRKIQDNRIRRSDYDNARIDRNASQYSSKSYENDKFTYSRNNQYSNRDIYSDRNDGKAISPERSVGRNPTIDEYKTRESLGRYLGTDDYHRNRFKDYHHGAKTSDSRYENEGYKYQHESRRQQYERSHSSTFETNSARGFSRRPSVGRYEEKHLENTVSVEADAGRSFTIDTSVNSTFQGFDKTMLNNKSFDTRRQRAASVGRIIVRENSVGRCSHKEVKEIRTFERGSSVGRSLKASEESSFQKGKGRPLAEAFVPSFNKHFYTNKPNNKFTRAQSVGRDCIQSSSKTFAETKAEFESYKVRSFEKHSDQKTSELNRLKKLKNDYKKKDIPKSEKYTLKDNRKDKNEPYSPRKNLRDPRMQKRPQDKYHVDHRPPRNPRDKAYGIVYSSDNIAKGNVIGPGVKNYKIPKIKKPIEDISGQDSDTSKSENPKSSDGETSKTKDKESIKNRSVSKESKSMVAKEVKLKENTKNKLTFNPKSSTKQKKNKEDDDEMLIRKSRNIRKNVICDSDSDDDTKTIIPESPKVQDFSETVSKVNADNISLGFEDDDTLDVFTENMAPKDVIDNIDNLIADLDKDIGNKIEGDLVTHINKDDVFDSLFDNIDKLKSLSPVNDGGVSSSGASIVNHTEKRESHEEKRQKSPEKPLLSADLSPSSEMAVPKALDIDIVNLPQKITSSTPQICVSASPKVLNLDSPRKTPFALPSNLGSPMCNDMPHNVNANIQLHNETSNKSEMVDDLPKKSSFVVMTPAVEDAERTPGSDNKEKTCVLNSTPDSTIENDEFNSNNCDGPNPDTEALAQPENMNPDVSSTHDSNNPSAEESTAATNTENKEIGSIHSILSLLQDKTKIKELLSLIGNQQEGEKLKKKLEKLSEIVSDDDDDKNDTTQNQLEATSEKEEKPENEVIEQKKSDGLEEMTDTIPQSDTSSEIINEKSIDDDSDVPIAFVSKKRPVKKFQAKKKGVVKRKQKKVIPKQAPKRLTRAGAAQKPKRANRELKKLHDDIRDMFMSNDVLNATGIRMCRLAKLSEEPSSSVEPDNDSIRPKGKPTSKKIESFSSANKPLVIIEKMPLQELEMAKPPRKKPGPKPKIKPTPKLVEEIKPPPKRKPGPKSKTKVVDNNQCDPYDFESDSASETTTKASENSAIDSSSDSENDSLTSSTTSIGSSELLIEIKSNKRRRRSGWKSGVIRRTKKKTQSNVEKQGLVPKSSELPVALIEKLPSIPDYDCFTDIRYSFEKNLIAYPCRLCIYEGENIVSHYKNNHPHYEIPLSRLKQNVAKEAIKQSMVTNFQKISNASVHKYVCRFCNAVFDDGRTLLLETFFWHVVSNHTGEYKQLCSECQNTQTCTFMLDIPPPPKNFQGLLMGYICGKCFYTQVSLENLKNHVSLRHNDEETEVYTISLAAITQQMIETMQNAAVEDAPRTLRNAKQFAASNSKTNSESEELSEPNRPSSVQSKISFENENDGSSIKNESESDNDDNVEEPQDKAQDLITREDSSRNDIFEHAHFKINISKSGAKEYICAATGGDDHYKTTLMISIKQHVQKSHTGQIWDGYCYFCKVIVMPQGKHTYKDCLTHFLDKHLEDGVVEDTTLEPADKETPQSVPEKTTEISRAPTPPAKTYISVKPISELLPRNTPAASSTAETTALDDSLPKIQSVMSLNSEVLVEPPIPLPVSEPMLPVCDPVIIAEVFQAGVAKTPAYEYEEWLKQIISNKYRIALETMLTDIKLSHVFKCPARYCSFTCDSPEDALIHVSTHLRMGCADALKCSYCSFDCSGNSIDLVSHVFKDHGNCKYSCTSCFYRGRTLAMVESHCQTTHAEVRKCAVLSSVVVDPSQSFVLTRKDAVKMYSCVYGRGTNKLCYFKAATPDKFCSHLSNDHPDLITYRCSECQISTITPALLIEHLSQKHQLKSFQCSWCVFGAETRVEILTHCSTKHPTEMPQAYWRKIIAKDGAPPKVLPLVSLSGPTSFATVEPISISKADPVREAERAKALEKLIGVTSQIAETAPEKAIDLPVETHDSDYIPCVAEEPLQLALEEPSTQSAVPSEPNTTTSPAETSVADRATPILKKEPIDEETDQKPITSAHVISLDSDDEDFIPPENENIIELSDSDGESSVLRKSQKASGPRLRVHNVYACRKCKNLFKNASGLKRHLIYCYGAGEQISCAHCTDVFMCTNTLVKHLKVVHGPEETYMCGVCSIKESDSTSIKSHLNTAHKVTKFAVNLSISEDGLTVTNTFTPEATQDPQATVRRGPKRKRSLTTQQPTSPKKVKKYSPDEIDMLPIAPIFEGNAHCSLCEFNTKVRVNMVRHLQAHAQKQPDLPEIAPVNPVPHLESNEMHFDRMVNLASSSITTRAPEQSSRSEQQPTITVHVPPAIAARYPKYVPERKRYACGAKSCNYISSDEDMLTYHWDTLHSGSNDYHCVHCPPNQHLDTSRPLTAGRIAAHLKMHDMRLYSCSECTYYHHMKHLVEKHISEKHNIGDVKIVREPLTGPVASSSTAFTAGPTMDLKSWQCGLCKFSTMLRPQLVEHCSRHHNSKFQFKCLFCPWRSSAKENVVKHHLTAHQQNTSEVFYFYYKEGSLPDVGGKPVWVVQKENSNAPEVKEDPEPVAEVTETAKTIEVNCDIVKKEPVEENEMNTEILCKKYGPLCAPNGLLYKCPFCKVVAESNKVSMQSHLFEELKYRRWACNICSYKAFHKQGLKDHASSEHKGIQENSTELPQDIGIESWVAMLLNHQDKQIAENLAKLNNMAIPTQKGSATTPPEISHSIAPQSKDQSSKTGFTNQELEKAFGSFGAPNNMMLTCPKCDFKTKDEAKMGEHLEMELTKVRWCCNVCTEKYTQYHQAQLHCRTAHPDAAARPLEALRDPDARRAWPLAVINVQKLSMNVMPFTADLCTTGEPEHDTPPVNNDLLVVRYEESIPTPDHPMNIQPPTPECITSEPTLGKRKRPGFLGEPESDDENLIIDERPSKKTNANKNQEYNCNCPHCDYSVRSNFLLHLHILQHYNLKPYSCGHCDFTQNKRLLIKHLEVSHPDKSPTFIKTVIPSHPPTRLDLKTKGKTIKQPATAPSQKSDDINNMATGSTPTCRVFICLICEEEVLGNATQNHVHPNEPPQYAKKGDLILKCTTCSILKNNLPAMKLHSTTAHPHKNLDYVYTKLLPENTGGLICKVAGCGRKFILMEDLKKHSLDSHAAVPLSFTITPSTSKSLDKPNNEKAIDDTRESSEKRKSLDQPNLVAKKSTTKLPSQSKIAKKSTTKLPLLYIEDSESGDEGFSFYGSKPAPLEEYSNVKTHMPFMNTVVPFTVNKLKDIVDIAPKIVVKKVPNDQ